LDAEQGLLSLIELNTVLAFDTVVSRHEVGLTSLARELVLLLKVSEIFVDLLHSALVEVLGGARVGHGGIVQSVLVLSHRVLSFDGEQPRIGLVPEGFNGDAVGRHFVFQELVHVDVVNVKLGVGDPDRGEGNLIAEDRELLAVSVESDVLNLSDSLTVLNFELTGDTELLVSSARDIEHFDHLLGGDHDHVLAARFNLNHFSFLLSHGEYLLDLARVAANFKLARLRAANDGVEGKCANIGPGFKIAEKLGALLDINVVNLHEFTVPEERVRPTAVNALNIHAQGHHDLVVGVIRVFVFDTHFNSLVRNLNHFEIVLHLFLKDRVGEDGRARGVQRADHVGVAAPLDLVDANS